MRDRKRVDLGEWGGGKELGREGRETCNNFILYERILNFKKEMQVLSSGITKVIRLLVTFIIPCNVYQKTMIQRVTFTVYMQSKHDAPQLLFKEIK